VLAILCALAGLSLSCNRDAQLSSVSGTIETDEVHVASRYGGRVEALYAQEGDTLSSGRKIAVLDAGELHARRERLAAQLAELEAGPRLQEIEAARNDWEAQAANLELARADAKRAAELFRQNTISAVERDEATTRAESLQKNVAAARSRFELLQAGTRPEQIAQARAQIAELETQLKEMTIAAPSDSVLEVLSVKVGDVLAPNQQLATLVLPQHLWVRVYIPEPWLGRIQLGATVTVRVDAFPGRDYSGIVEQINRQAEFTPRNVQTQEERIRQVFGVKVRLDSGNKDLRAGMSADVFFPNAPQRR
jgi:HlyD family secretion protein